MKNGIMLMFVMVMVITSCATSKSGESTKMTSFIQTNAQCGDCKERIEGLLNYEKGIIYSNLDLETKIVEVKYNTKKTSLEEVKKVISGIGYNADEVKALKTAQNALPSCCKPGGMDKKSK